MQKLQQFPLDFENDHLILTKESGYVFHLWFQTIFPFKYVYSKCRIHEYLEYSLSYIHS